MGIEQEEQLIKELLVSEWMRSDAVVALCWLREELEEKDREHE